MSMSAPETAAVVLAAGLGTRMKSDRPKVMHPIAGRPMVGHLVATLEAMGLDRIVVVVGPESDTVAKALAPHPCVVQRERLGTGHAVLAARPALEGFTGDVLVLFGDSPLVETDTLSRMLRARRDGADPAVVVSGFRAADPGAYGRLITNGDGGLEAIVEARDATPAQRRVDLCNSGFMAIDGRRLFGLLDRIGNDNAKGEYYLTDIVALARADGAACAVVEGEEAEFLGINSRAELAAAEAWVQERLRAQAMAGGATLVAPQTVYFSHDTRLGRDVVVGPHVVFGPGVVVSDEVEILSFSHIEGANIAARARIGPFARLRPGARLGTDAHVGNFVEVKNATVEAGAKANHLSYIGDARVGAGANVGAGTITCNYDGFLKHHTDIGAGAFIGSNTALVAPVKVGDGASIGAGSVITRDVAAGALAVERADQKDVPGWAARNRRRKAAAKAKLHKSKKA